MTPPDAFDVFLSYRHADAAPVRRLATALESNGLRVWIDDSEIADFASIQTRIQNGLARSKALVAWYSAGYPESRACQWELTAAYLGALRTGIDPRARVLVVNPEPANSHIHPVELRDAKFVTVGTSPSDATVAALAASVHSRVAGLSESFGVGQVLTPPRWHGAAGTGSNRFVGRLADLWRLHTALWSGEHAIVTGAFSAGTAQLTGLGGVGKSLLAEEYARRFGAAYPGGVFWIRAFGNDTTRRPAPTSDPLAALHDQTRTFAVEIGVPTSGLSPDDLAAAFARQLDQAELPFLWVVDDVANGLSAEELGRWRAPGRFGKTLMTTRSREYDAVGDVLRVDALSTDEAFALLTSRRTAQDAEQRLAAMRITAALGCHPLALDVAGAALGYYTSFVEFEQALGQPSEDALDLAKEYVGLLPNGHEPSIAATLLSSVERLGAEGKDLLTAASVLAVAPISVLLLGRIVSTMESVSEDEGRRQARAAFNQVDKLSLAEDEGTDSPSRVVHGLVSRVMRHRKDVDQGARRRQIRASATDALSEILRTAADVRQHQAIAHEVAHAREVVEGAQDVGGARLLGWLARYDYIRGFARLSSRMYREQLSLNRELLGPEHPDTLIATNNLAEALGAQGNLSEARVLHESVLALRKRLLGPEHPDTLTSMNNLAGMLRTQGDLLGARALEEDALALRKRLLGPEHPTTLTSMNNLAGTLAALGDLAGARRLEEEALELSVQLRGSEHPDTLPPMINLAGTLRDLGDLAGARALEERALSLQKRLFGLDHPNTATLMDNLAKTFRAQGDVDGARALHEEALALRTRLLGQEHPDTVTSMSNVAGTLAALGDLAGARALEEEALALWKRRLGSEHPHTLISMNNLAETLRLQGDLAGAQALHRDALALWKRLLGREHPNTSVSAWNLVATLAACEQIEESLAVLKSELEWLLEREPTSLGAAQRRVREQVAERLGRDRTEID